MTHDTPKPPFTIDRHTWQPRTDDSKEVPTLTEAIATVTRYLSDADAAYALAVVRDPNRIMVYAADSTGRTWDRAETGTTAPVVAWLKEVSSC